MCIFEKRIDENQNEKILNLRGKNLSSLAT